MLERYAKYSFEDFVKDEKFLAWVKSSGLKEELLWKEVGLKFPYQQGVMNQAREFIHQLSEASGADGHDLTADEIWQYIEKEMVQEEESKRVHWGRWLAAASVLLLLGLGWLLYSQRTPDTVYTRLTRETKKVLKEVVNEGQSAMTVYLPDGSEVVLEKHSRISYAENFTQKNRVVYLSGVAFFDVTKNPEKPFVVYANELVTKVLGTRFKVSALDQARTVTVSVQTGKVSVYPNTTRANVDPETKGIILIPNQEASFERENESISRSLVTEPELVIPKETLQTFSFANAPVNEIFKAMEKAYGIDFLYDEELLTACRLNTSLTDETLFEQLDVICEAIGATYKVVDAQVVITAGKCN